MNRLSKSQKELLRNSLEFATIGQSFRCIFWDIFKPKKSKKLIDLLEDGLHWNSAYNAVYNDTKN